MITDRAKDAAHRPPANLGARYGLTITCADNREPSAGSCGMFYTTLEQVRIAAGKLPDDDVQREHDAQLRAEDQADARAEARKSKPEFFDARRIP